MNRSDLINLIGSLDWMDNSKLNVIRGCQRRAFYQLIGPDDMPLSDGAGDGAAFGTLIHYGLEYYYTHPHPDYITRVMGAIRATYKHYPTLFDMKRLDIDKKHNQDNTAIILNGYFDRFKREDEDFTTLKAEFGIALLVKPEEGDIYDHFEPFFYLMKGDRLLERKANKELAILETKTIGSGDVVKRAEFLRFNNQPIGYTYVTRRYLQYMKDDRLMSTFIPDIVLVSATQLEYHRDSFIISENRLRSWRNQLIFKVEEWRRYRELLKKMHHRDDYFDFAPMDTEECSNYGKCFFYSLCEKGPMSPVLRDYKEHEWHPFNDLENDQIVIIE